MMRKMRSEGATLEAIGLRYGITPAAARYHLKFGLQVHARRKEIEQSQRGRATEGESR